MRATENAIELLARQSHGTILALDELAHAPGRAIGRIIYSLAGNTGKSRMTSGRTLLQTLTWSTFVLSSGEHSLEQKVREDDGQWSSGMAARFCDIDVASVNARVAPDKIAKMHGIFEHYGHAGPAFVEALVAKGMHQRSDLLRQRILVAARDLAGGGADSATIRAATPLAVLAIAGQLAEQFQILPREADVIRAVEWAWERYSLSTDAEALDPERRAIANIQRWVAERWDVTIKNVEPNTGTNNREAVAWYDDKVLYLPTARIAEAAGNVLNTQTIAALLARKDYLARRTNSRRIAVGWIPKIGYVQAYALKRSEFGGRADAASDPNLRARSDE